MQRVRLRKEDCKMIFNDMLDRIIVIQVYEAYLLAFEEMTENKIRESL